MNSKDANPRITERVDQMNQTAQQFVNEAKGTVRQLEETLDLRGRVERNPYGMMLAAVGAGYVLGGGLFTPFTGKIVRLGLKLAALPLVKDELLGIAEAAVDRYVGSSMPPEPDGPGSRSEGGGAR
ncbi:MAG: hypothetical protein WBV82_09955 [Myxococcaceae bacterium]